MTDPGAVARRLGRGHRQPGHRPDREEARGAGIARLHQEHDRRRARPRSSSICKTRPRRRRRGDLGAGPQHDQRHHAASSRKACIGPVFQRPLRRRVRQHLCLHRRRPDPAAAARLCRGRPRQGPDACPMSARSSIIGAQDEVIYLEFSTRKIAALGIDQQAIIATLQAQNAITPSGVMQAGPERISVRVSGQFTSEESLHGDQPADQRPLLPPERRRDHHARLYRSGRPLFRYNGEPAIGLAIGMKPDANLLEFGEALQEEMIKVIGELPVGVGVHLVSDQPVVVEEAVSGFTKRCSRPSSSFSSSASSASACAPGSSSPVDPAGARHHLRGDGLCRHLAAAHLARRPDHRARPSGRRRHDRGRDDGGAARGRRSPEEGGDLRLYVDGLSRC